MQLAVSASDYIMPITITCVHQVALCMMDFSSSIAVGIEVNDSGKGKYTQVDAHNTYVHLYIYVCVFALS